MPAVPVAVITTVFGSGDHDVSSWAVEKGSRYGGHDTALIADRNHEGESDRVANLEAEIVGIIGAIQWMCELERRDNTITREDATAVGCASVARVAE